MTGLRLATPRDLWDATDTLLNPSRVRLSRDDQPPQWVKLPSLWDQLIEAIESGNGQKTGSIEQSKPPCDSTALSLVLEIATAVRDTCMLAKIRRTHEVPKDLRQIVSHVIRQADQAALDKSHTLIRGWAARVRVTISNDPDRTWRMHGAACRICGSTTVPVWDQDGDESRQPALIVHSEDGVIHGIECAFCGQRLDGDDLTQLLYDTLRRPAQLSTGRVAIQ